MNDKIFEGQRCGKCGNKQRYISSRQCIVCHALKSKERHEIKMRQKVYQRPKFTKPKHTLSVRLSDMVYEALVANSEKNRRSMAAEIELVLENHYDL